MQIDTFAFIDITKYFPGQDCVHNSKYLHDKTRQESVHNYEGVHISFQGFAMQQMSPSQAFVEYI